MVRKSDEIKQHKKQVCKFLVGTFILMVLGVLTVRSMMIDTSKSYLE